jgi:hypothetical protein
VVTEYLEQMTNLVRGLKRANDWKYQCIEEFVLKNGKVFSVNGTKVKRGRTKECFKNAFCLAEYNPDLSYVEGYATFFNLGFPVLHAWCVDKQGNVYDPTWKKLGDEYFGVVFELSFVRETIFARKKFGVIDNREMNFPLLSGKEVL